MNSNPFSSSKIPELQKTEGFVRWQSPSNIALIKYWGKFGVQLPKNPSLSFSLTEAYSQMSIKYSLKKSAKSQYKFFFEGKENPVFGEKVLRLLIELETIFPFLKQLDIEIESENSFPHSAGIASSASSMSALALCLCSIERETIGSLKDENDFYRKASYVARLGSGSASRSIFGGFSVWGEFAGLVESSNEYAIPFPKEVHSVFMKLRDSILIVSDSEKTVSSRAGHALMNGHPYAEGRIAQSNENMSRLITSLQNGDTDLFIEVVENEAMSLHALMMSSKPWYSLMHPNTLNILNKLKAFRAKSALFICFTLDAGSNVHLLYNKDDEKQVLQFIENELLNYCYERKIINDRIGTGSKRLD